MRLRSVVARMSGGGRGTPLEPAGMLRGNESIAAAIANSSQDFRTIRLAPDTWHVGGTITVAVDNVTISGSGLGTVLQLQRGTKAALLSVTGDDVLIENVSFVTESGTGVSPEYAIAVAGNNCTIRNCTFNGFYRTIFATDNLRLTLANNRFKNSGAGCIDLNNTDYSVISGNIIETNATGNEIDLDANCQYNSIFGNVAVGGVISISTSGGQANKYAANSPTAVTT